MVAFVTYGGTRPLDHVMVKRYSLMILLPAEHVDGEAMALELGALMNLYQKLLLNIFIFCPFDPWIAMPGYEQACCVTPPYRPRGGVKGPRRNASMAPEFHD